MNANELKYLRSKFNKQMYENLPVSSYTSARVGGTADTAIIVNSKDELVEIGAHLWDKGIQFTLIGGGSNVLISDKGIRELLIINKAKSVLLNDDPENPSMVVDSGTSMNDISQKAANWGLSGLEWAATVPGTLGGAIYGNAGAFGGDIAGNLLFALILLPEIKSPQEWKVEKLEYKYRSSVLKRERIKSIILSGTLSVSHSSQDIIRRKMKENSENRKLTQPKGASMGSTFKNPPGDHAGRLLEATGLKGKRVGNAEISSIHANFIINHGKSTAADIKTLIDIAQQEVEKKFGIKLELEIELAGEW